MAIFTGGKSKAINSPRHLTLRHARRAVALKRRELGILLPDEQVDDPSPLDPGEEQLNSYWAPGLEAGRVHRASVTQTVDANNGDQPLELTAEQDFFVDAPQFSLPEGSIYSVYPPSGYNDDHRILPHVVLTDPHLPWERLGDPNAPMDRNMVPWLALFSFTQDELRLPPSALDPKTGIFSKTSDQLQKPVKQTPTMAVNMTVSDLWATNDTTTPVTSNLGPPTIKDSRGDFIFLQPDLFTSLFSTFDSSNQRQVPASPQTSQYKFLSHVRNINTTGMAVAGVEEVGIFSVVVGNRAGPLDNPVATTVSVHLVSIEGVTAMKFPIETSYVALCSLHSWNYTVNPPGMLNVPDAFEHLGETLDVLRPPSKLLQTINNDGNIPSRLLSRLEDGYSLVKYRTQTGESTVALFRGPFTPTTVRPLSMNNSSNSGVDLQILDEEVGIMDITYSSAWQLGRTLALGDQAFAAALSRLRSTIHNRAMYALKISILKEKSPNSFRTRTDVLSNLTDTVKALAQIHIPHGPHDGNSPQPFRPGGPLKRWHRRRLLASERPDLSFHAPRLEDKYLEQAIIAARALALATDGTIYDETNTPVSSDWMIILAWVMNRMFLAGVPAHYLITDPSHLENESLRFFYIDPNWVDAMIDGALSLANHMGDDKDRVAIKVALNDFIQSKPELLPHAPQIPTYGFLLRSDLVTMFPDLRVSTLPPPPVPPVRAPLLRHEIVTDGVMLALLDRLPGSPESDFTGLVFTQPPHQQRFAVARDLEANSIKVDIRRQYTVDQSIRAKDPNRHLTLSEISMVPSDSDNLFVWGSKPGLTDLHILRLPRFADVQLTELSNKMGDYVDGNETRKYFDDDTATSALFALQLNDPIYNLTISFKEDPSSVRALTSLSPPEGAAAANAPRTLKLLTPSKVTKLMAPPATPSKNPSKEPDHAALAATATYKRLSKPSATFLQANLAPHIRAAVTETAPRPAPTPRKVAFDPANPPRYDCATYTPLFTDVQTGSGLQQDLIFAVHVKNNKDSSYQLQEFDIRIRLGGVDPERNMLFKDYDGPGPSMLSNLRFNVLADYPKIEGVNYMQLRLLPRSEVGWIDITSVSEMGFVLALAQVNEFPQQLTQVQVDTFAYYQDVIRPLTDSFDINIINTNFNK